VTTSSTGHPPTLRYHLDEDLDEDPDDDEDDEDDEDDLDDEDDEDEDTETWQVSVGRRSAKGQRVLDFGC